MKAATDYTVRSKIAKQLGVDVKMVSAMGMEFVRSLKARKEFIISAIKMSKNYNVTKEATIEQLIAQFELSSEEATELVTLHWE